MLLLVETANLNGLLLLKNRIKEFCLNDAAV